MKKLFLTVLIGLFVMGITGTASAVILAPGAGDTPISGGALLSSTFVTSVVAPFSFGLGTTPMTGTVTEKVYTNRTGMLFTYELARDPDASVEVITRLTASDFTGFWVNANFNPLGTGNIATEVDRHSAGVVGFEFDPISSGEFSKKLWIQTNAKSYQTGYVSLIDGRTADLTMLGPATPEPSSLMLLGMGILGLFGLGKKKL